LQGQRNFTPEQMTQLLDRATQENPHLDQSGAIRKAFQDLVGRGDMDGASRFVQSLRPSYDNLRAAMTAAVGQGQWVQALQIAERMNNLIPNGNQVSFHPTENGLITAIVRPENGEAARTYHLTPQQFQDYVKGAGSVFDIAAQQGIDHGLQQASRAAPQGMDPENAPPYQVAGAMQPPPVNPPANQPAPAGAQPAPAEGVPTPRPRPAAADQMPPERLPSAAQVADRRQQWQNQRPGDVITGRSNAAASGKYDIERPPRGYQKYGRDVRDPDGWPSGVPRGGQFSRRYYDVGGHTYDLGRDGMPLAQQGQPGFHGPLPGQPGWNGTYPPGTQGAPRTGYDIPQMPTRGADPITGRPSYNPNAIRPDQPPPAGQGTGYQNSPARRTFDPATNTVTPETTGQGGAQNAPVRAGSTTDPNKPPRAQTGPTVQQTGPTVQQTGPAQQQPNQQQQPQQTQQGQRQDPNLRPDGSVRRYGEPYHGTPEQKRAQYQSDMKEYAIKQQAFQAYPNAEDRGKRSRYEDTLRERTARQERFTQGQTTRQQQADATQRRFEETQRNLNNRALEQRLTQMGMQRERLAFQDLENRVKAHQNTPDGKLGLPYSYTEQDRQLLDKIRQTAIENDMWEQLRPRLQPDSNAPPARPTAPAAPPDRGTGGGAKTSEPATAAPNGGNGKVDLETYRGNEEPYPAPKGMQWGRSKSTGKWSLRPTEQAPARPTVPLSQ